MYIFYFPFNILFVITKVRLPTVAWFKQNNYTVCTLHIQLHFMRYPVGHEYFPLLHLELGLEGHRTGRFLISK